MDTRTQSTDEHAVVVALTTEHLRAIEAALDLARAVEHGEISVSDPDELGQASVAADPLAHAPGSLLMLRTREDGDRLVQVQDVGSAIKGEGRIDLFTGSGAEAGEMAGRLKAPLQVIRLAARAAVTAGSAARPDAPGAQSESAIALANCSAGI